MKISCQSCAAKYTIADEKVVGKVIKIKCKKCGATIVVNGNDPAALAQQVAAEAASFDDNAATQLFGQADAGGAANPDEWTVSVTDDDQRTMTTAQVVEAYAQGVIQADTYVWRDGMGDWLPLSDVAELAPHLAGAAANGHGAAAGYAAPQAGAFAPGGGMAYETTAAMPSPQMPAAAQMPAAQMPAAQMAAAAPVAARKANARGSNVDLFGAREEPRGAAAAAAHAAAHNIGERNESSVLFSLASLNAAEEAAKKADKKETFKASNDRVDDILSLGGGMSMGGPILAPPPMNAPVIEAPPPPPPMSIPPASYAPAAMAGAPYAMQPQKKASPVGFIVGGVGALAAIGMLVFFLTRGSSDKKADTDSTSKPADTGASADTSKPAAVALNDTSKPADTGTAADTSKPADTGTAADTSKPADTAKPDDKAVKDFKAAVDSKGSTPAPTKTETPKKEDPAPKKEEPKKEDPPPAAGGTAEFDRGAASAQLSAKAGGASGCKKPDGPTGSAKVQVTFAPSGRVTQATVGAPFAGTPVGSCIASLFKSASVPPFSGGAMTVSKTVSVR